jgi:hypothetical protein
MTQGHKTAQAAARTIIAGFDRAIQSARCDATADHSDARRRGAGEEIQMYVH